MYKLFFLSLYSVECKFTCHKRCYKKYKTKCTRKKSVTSVSCLFFFFLWDVLLSYVVVLITTFVFQECVFGNQLPACELVSDSIQIPTLVARLINEIENKGEKGFEISV